MGRFKQRLGRRLHAVETFFDRVKLGYKRRFNRFGPIHIQAYRGYGTPDEVFLEGRVLDDKEIRLEGEQSRWQNIVNTIRRIESDEIPGARVCLHFRGHTQEAETDRDGFFAFRFQPDGMLDEDQAWHEADFELLAPPSRVQEKVTTRAHFIVPRRDAEFGVISDIDDTVVRTGATDKLQMARVVLLNSGRTRMPFEGVGTFYRALQQGPDGRSVNPIFYVSSSPINFYGHFAHFLDERDIPLGPILLKDFGFSEEKFFSSGHHTYKLDHIETLLDTYPDLPFVLVGDSGQQDAEIYREAVRTHGADRIAAIYIRDVTPEQRDQRDEAVETIAEEVRDMGVPMVLVQDTVMAAEHAAEHGLIQEEAIEAVRQDKLQEQETKQEPSFLERLIG